VSNPTTSFPITVGATTAPSTFIFDSENRAIIAWNPTVDPVLNGQSMATLVVNNSGARSTKVLPSGRTYMVILFATNLAAGSVDVFDQNVALATLDRNFSDPDIPAGLAPFGIANIDNNLHVTYAKQNAQKNDVIPGAGLGFVDVCTTDGVLIQRFASRGTLNAPWGIAGDAEFRPVQRRHPHRQFRLAGRSSRPDQACSGGENNPFLGPLLDAQGKPISIDGLWPIVFGTFLNSDPDTLYSLRGQISRRTACSARSWRSNDEIRSGMLRRKLGIRTRQDLVIVSLSDAWHPSTLLGIGGHTRKAEKSRPVWNCCAAHSQRCLQNDMSCIRRC
jgi:uncharacterized protein (TIGR03118 family)